MKIEGGNYMHVYLEIDKDHKIYKMHHHIKFKDNTC